jgi:endo-alpha-N-acetylgalactosaminidase
VSELNVLAQSAPGPQQDPAISRSAWKVQYVDSQETSASYDAAANVFDGRTDTIWATEWAAATPLPPHEIQIDLGGTYTVSGFRYLPRQNGQTYGNIGRYEFYVSTDAVTWGSAVATGTFPTGSAEQVVTFTAKTGRYIRLRALSEIGGHPWTAVAELNVLGQPSTPASGDSLIPRTAWTLHYVDSQETSGADERATNAFDGRPDTIWATQWLAASPTAPHEIQINMGATYKISGFRYLPRQNGQTYGNIARYEFYVSTDGVNWGTAVATGTFTAGSTEQQVTFASRSGRFVRLRALSEVNGNPWTAVSELQVLQAAP